LLVVAAIALNLYREAEELIVVFLKPLKVRLDRSCNLFRIFHGQEMPHNLAVMFGLPREPKRRVLLLRDFCIGHYLNLLERFRRLRSVRLSLRRFAVH